MGFTDTNSNYHTFRETLNASLNDFREAVTGDVLAIAGNGGILASDTTPSLSGTSTGISQQISWVAGNVDQILCQYSLPEDFDGREDVLVDLWVNSGTTDLASFTLASAWDGGASVSTTCTDPLQSATTHLYTVVIQKASVPDAPSYVSFSLVPATHATDAITLVAFRVRFVERNT